MTFKELGYFLRGRINIHSARTLNALRGPSRPPRPAGEAPGDPSLLEIVRVLEGRSDPAREAAVGRLLVERGLPFSRHPFATIEGKGVNFAVDLGEGERFILLIGHHDAVPGSPGANDNGAAVAILLSLAGRLLSDPPRGIRVRVLFTGCEERCYLGARCYAREVPLEGLLGVLSLELCGIGDQFAIWDVPPQAGGEPFLQAFAGALERLGYRRDETYHIVGRIPVFGSDHRAFAALGVPAFGLTVAPGEQAERLREFVFKPWRAALHQLVDRPPPFHTYHTPRDSSETLEPGAMERTREALLALVKGLAQDRR